MPAMGLQEHHLGHKESTNVPSMTSPMMDLVSITNVQKICCWRRAGARPAIIRKSRKIPTENSS
jgi:hypothetical protein